MTSGHQDAPPSGQLPLELGDDDSLDAQARRNLFANSNEGSDEEGSEQLEQRDVEDDDFLEQAGQVDGSGKGAAPKNAALGFVFIGIIVVIWVAASFLIQNIEGKIYAPFFLTYASTGMFTLLLPLAQFSGGLGRIRANDAAIAAGGGDPSVYSLRYTFRGACMICPFWFMANFFYNLGLHFTSVTSSTILSGTSAVFTLALGSWLGLERVTFSKTLGVAACLWGTAMVGLADNGSAEANAATSSATLGGDAATLLGSFFYACYTLLIDKLFPGGDATVDMAVLFGCIGLVNCICLAPVVAVLHFTSAESLSTLTVGLLCWILFNGFFNNVVSDYLFARAVLMTSPTITSVGLSMTIPVATVVDILLKQALPPLLTLSGAVLVTAGFLAVSLGGAAEPDAKPVRREMPGQASFEPL